MTRTPDSGTAPPGTNLPAVPSQPAPGGAPAVPAPAAPPGAPRPAAPPPDVRRTAFAEGTERLRRAATTEPGRLRIIGAVLAALVLAFGAVSAWQMTDRAAAADDVLNRSQPLS
ncbi:hypothetical protein G3I38_30195, partial [Streptomyces sp. SID7958]|nr:hypothetical protein [Streptomyces sp. SID7958]